MGSDEPAVSGNNGRPKNNVFDTNVISNTNVGTKIKDGDDNTFTSECQVESPCVVVVAPPCFCVLVLLFGLEPD